MPTAETTRDIAEQAAGWAARAAYGEMDDDDRLALEAWLSADRRHRGAYLRARAALCAMEEAVLEAPRETGAVNDNLSVDMAGRRRLGRGARALVAGAALAACAAGIVLIGPWHIPSSAIHQPDERRVALADGSVALLSADAQVSAYIDSTTRTVVLRSGQATFEVARDPDRPFVVRTGDVYAQATGTVYSVSKLGKAGGEVSVNEGTVLVWLQGERNRALSLRAGESVTLSPERAALAQPLPERSAPVASRATGELSFDNIPLSAAAKRFNAVNDRQIVVEDPVIAATPIVGLFSADDPESFARAAAAVSGARVTIRGDTIAIGM